MKNMKILVVKNTFAHRYKDKTAPGACLYHAQIDDDDALWSEGNTPYEAIGRLVTKHAKMFNIVGVNMEYLDIKKKPGD